MITRLHTKPIINHKNCLINQNHEQIETSKRNSIQKLKLQNSVKNKEEKTQTTNNSNTRSTNHLINHTSFYLFQGILISGGVSTSTIIFNIKKIVRINKLHLYSVGEGNRNDVARLNAGGEQLRGCIIDELIEACMGEIEPAGDGDGTPRMEYAGDLLQQTSESESSHLFKFFCQNKKVGKCK